MNDPFRALYLHVPFCVRRCAYCDFHTRAVDRDDVQLEAHVDGLVASLRRARVAGLLDAVETVYVGGGTPTFLGTGRLGRLLAALPSGCAELTVEANPESLTEDMAALLAGGGVTRVSIGVQSLDDAVLHTLGRTHDAARARKAVSTAVGRIGNVSADVICGVPGQSASSLRSTIEELLALDVSHVSIYPLMVEEGTPLERAIEHGELPDVDDDVQASHMELAAEVLEAAGMARYEVASYAYPGHESRHNEAYWTGVPYLGLGEGAASMFDASDFEEVARSGVFGPLGDPPEGAARVRIARTGERPDMEFLTPEEIACEDAMLAMRMSAGISRARLGRLASTVPELIRAADRAVELELACWQDGRLVPTQRGWLCGNELYGLFWDCARLWQGVRLPR